jgi:uncharacterized protein YlzI (FlbEa/FlbD family)
MIKLTTMSGQPVLVNLFCAPQALTVVSPDSLKRKYCTLINGVYVQESLDDILNLQIAALRNVIKALADES